MKSVKIYSVRKMYRVNTVHYSVYDSVSNSVYYSVLGSVRNSVFRILLDIKYEIC